MVFVISALFSTIFTGDPRNIFPFPKFVLCIMVWMLGLDYAPDKVTAIVGGKVAQDGELKYQVSLKHDGKHVCGGSIISKDWVLTAAHCVNERNNPDDWEVEAGSFKLHEGLSSKVTYIVSHPHFNSSNFDWDAALMKVEKPFEFNDRINKVDLPAFGYDPIPGQKAILSGWGLTEEYGQKMSKFLQMVEVPIVSRDSCAENHTQITENMICAGEKLGGKDACQLDSGGPLVIDNILQGIISFGRGCARPDIPGVHARVSLMMEFIQFKFKS